MPGGTFIPPPIPVHLAPFPIAGGLVVPFTTLRHFNGKAAFGLVDSIRNQQCLHEQRCSVCGQVIGGRMVFFMRAIDLARKCSTEPAACPPCAAYTQEACPMVSGYLEHYRKAIAPFVTRRCGDESCPCWAWLEPAKSTRYGAPADRWHALWTRQYSLAHDADGRLVADFSGLRVLKLREIRPVSGRPTTPATGS